MKAVRAEAGAASREAGLTELAPAGLKRRPGAGPLMDSTWKRLTQTMMINFSVAMASLACRAAAKAAASREAGIAGALSRPSAGPLGESIRNGSALGC